MTYTLYFELYGHKMRATVEARTEEEARDIIRYKIRFDKVVLAEDEAVDVLKEMFGMK